MSVRIRRIVAGIAEIQEPDPHLAPAVDLASELGATLHLVHGFRMPDAILLPPEALDASESSWLEVVRRDRQERLRSAAARVSGTASIECHAIHASPSDAILDVAEQERADLILTGATRRGTLASALLGTTAQRVLRASSLPVLVNRRRSCSPPGRVLLTTDLSELSARVHAHALALLRDLWGEKITVHSLFVAGDDVLLPPIGYQIAMQRQAEANLSTFLTRADSKGFNVQPRVRLGLSVREILQEAHDWEPDLVVMGTRSRTGASRFLIGSVAEAVARKAPTDILLIPAAALRS